MDLVRNEEKNSGLATDVFLTALLPIYRTYKIYMEIEDLDICCVKHKVKSVLFLVWRCILVF